MSLSMILLKLRLLFWRFIARLLASGVGENLFSIISDSVFVNDPREKIEVVLS